MKQWLTVWIWPGSGMPSGHGKQSVFIILLVTAGQFNGRQGLGRHKGGAAAPYLVQLSFQEKMCIRDSLYICHHTDRLCLQGAGQKGFQGLPHCGQCNGVHIRGRWFHHWVRRRIQLRRPFKNHFPDSGLAQRRFGRGGENASCHQFCHDPQCNG